MKRYTAQEMRDAADATQREVYVDDYGRDVICGSDSWDAYAISAMLRQAADDMEREEMRERRYEYSVKYINKKSGVDAGRETYVYGSAEMAKYASKPYACEVAVIVRREVGEWEEVREEHSVKNGGES